MQAEIDVIVVGAGIAGMAAAAELAKSGRHVLVLEANDYIGGRLKTRPIPLSNNTVFPFEEGANWIHGFNNTHPIAKLSKEIEAVKLVETDDDLVITYDENKKNIDDQVDKQEKEYEKILEKAQQIQNVSVYQAIKKINGSKLHNKSFMYHVSNDVEFQTASTINELSAQHGFEDPAYKGREMLVISGYQQFAVHLGRNPKIKVLLKHQVSQIIFDGSKTNVRCLNGHSFEAKNIIFSAPLGVLKSKSIKFVPELPAWKEEAIQKIGFGNVCKILIVLKNKLIKRKQHYIGVIANEVQKRGSATYFLNVAALTGQPAFMTFGLGPNANQLQSMPEKDVKDLIASRLRIFSDPSFSPQDFQIVRSTWKTNPNFKGAYSSAGVATKPHHWFNMAKPIFQRNWYFCGQHTQENHRGTVHGAYQSGVFAAYDILNKVHSGNWKYKGKLAQENDD